jgi:dynein heavy chain
VITEQRESYRTAATRGSILYFVIADLALIDPMYQYSLEFFAGLFNKRLADSEKSEVKEERIALIIADLTSQFYINICRGLFEKDKLMYSFLNTTSILRRADAISAIEWAFFLRGSSNDYSEHQVRVEYVSEKTW